MKSVNMKTPAVGFVLLFLMSFVALEGRAQYIDHNQTTIYVGMALPRTNLNEYAEQGINVGIRITVA